MVFAGCQLLLVGTIALASAAFVTLLPHEHTFLNSTLAGLHDYHHDGSLVAFMVHNRVSFAGALLITGWLYLWLAIRPLRRGESWAWWTLLISGYAGGSSFLAYLGHGYIDSWHAAGTAGIMLTMALGLALSYPVLQRPRGFIALLPPGNKAKSEPPKTLEMSGRWFMTVWAAATIGGGSLVLLTGMLPIFVPQDLEFMQTTAAGLERISIRLLPFIAHDRIGFGGALVAWGVAALACVWHGLEPGHNRLLLWLAAAWLVGVITAIGIHPVVGYNSLSHLLPFMVKDGAFVLGLGCWYYNSTAPFFQGAASRLTSTADRPR
jgi:hypothetical protein